MREYHTRRTQALIALKLMIGKRLKLIVDGTILELAKPSRARTKRVRRFSGKVFWAKRKRKVYSEHYEKFIKFEEVFYGMLVMVDGCM